MPDVRGFTPLLCGRIHVREEQADDEAIALLARRQHGIVARGQLLDLSVSSRAIEHRLRVGRLRRVHAGVYAVGHEAMPYSARAAAAVLSLLPKAAASHTTAAALWGLCDPPAGPIAVTTAESRRSRLGVRVHRGALPASELALVRGIPVTSVARTLLDLSGQVEERRLRRLLKQAEFLGLTDLAALTAVLERHPRRRGRRPLARLVRGYMFETGRTRSELEDRFLAFCAGRGLPLPETNQALKVGGRRFEVDCVWRSARLVVELDGRAAHRTEEAFESDRARDRALIAGGWLPMRVTWAHLHRQADTLESEIRNALGTCLPQARGFPHTGGV
ncbi:MAG: endonuclease domain-containing protein [Solirubrobacterales bacterium]